MSTSPLRATNSRRWIKRSAKIAAIAAALASLAGISQEYARLSARADLASDAFHANAGSHSLRLKCTGSGDRTYILEAGATGFAETWHWVQDELDDEARVCSYDRAGMGLSEPSPLLFAPDNVARDLHAALEDAGETGPFILVGHSMGGFFVRDFAAQFPQDTAALIFVDSSHEDQLNHFSPDMVADFRAFPKLLSGLGYLSMTGLLRAWNPLEAGAAGLEGNALTAAKSFAGDRVHLATSAEELRHWDAIVANATNQELPAEIPVLAITAGSPVPGSEDFSDIVEPLHRELASRFASGEQVTMEEANHFSILMDRKQAMKLARLIEGYVSQM